MFLKRTFGKEKNSPSLLPSPLNHQNEANIWKNKISVAWI
jgi:hypothetical protein